jgi:hypothetical protein
MLKINQKELSKKKKAKIIQQKKELVYSTKWSLPLKSKMRSKLTKVEQ